jgi:hypothetical protein
VEIYGSVVDGLNSTVVSEATGKRKVARPVLVKEVKLFFRNRLWVIYHDPFNNF